MSPLIDTMMRGLEAASPSLYQLALQSSGFLSRMEESSLRYLLMMQGSQLATRVFPQLSSVLP